MPLVGSIVGPSDITSFIFMPTNKQSYHSISKDVLFTAKISTENQSWSKGRDQLIVGYSAPIDTYIHRTTSASKTQGMSWDRGRKIVRARQLVSLL